MMLGQMTESTRLFAVRVLLLHGLAFLALLIITLAGVWSAYVRAQHQSADDAGGRLQVVAQQTARGIESYYSSILENIHLITREELASVLPSPPPDFRRRGPVPTTGSTPLAPAGLLRSHGLAAREREADRTIGPAITSVRVPFAPDEREPANGGPRSPLGFRDREPERVGTSGPATRGTGDFRGRERSFLSAVWRQIESRATHLIAVRSDTGRLVRVEQRPDSLPAADLLAPAAEWLASANASPVSDRYEVSGFAYTLLGVNFATNESLKIVAVVPLDEIGARFIDAVRDRRQTIGAALIDDHSTILYATDRTMIGTNLERDAVDPAVKRRVRLNRAATGGFNRIDSIELQGGRRTEQAILASDPVHLLGGKSWTVSVNAPLDDVGGVVNEIFRDTLFWAPIVVTLFAGVLVSTAVTLIRIRSRLERVRHQAIDNELIQARQIQLSWLPKTRFDGRGLHIAAINEPASHVSGDFYNYFTLPDGRVALVIGDVTGHGMAAAFLMATTQLIVRLILNRTKDLALTLNETNRVLCEQVYSGQFVTLQVIVLDRANGTLDIVNAGHPPPIRLAGGVAEYLPTQPQIVLGVDDESDYFVETFAMPVETSLLLYTDGVIECRNARGDRFSMQLLLDALNGAPGDSQLLLARVTEIVNTFRGAEPLADDTTAVAVQLQPLEVEADRSATFIGEAV